MNRRTFLKTAGALSLAAGLGGGAARAEILGAPNAMRIDMKAVQNRNQNRSTVACRNGVVCASQPMASICGVDILKAGGNAIDAAVCANAMLGLVEPMNCGPGGDLFAIVWIEKDKKLYALNASGRSPYDWNLSEAQKRGLSAIPANNALAWNVPGCVSGWAALLQRFGSRPFGDVLAPAIGYAREGFVVSPIVSDDWGFGNDKDIATLTETFGVDGKPPRFGDVFRNPDYANSLELIARGGADAFYRGEIGEKIVKDAQTRGALLSMRDLHDHTADWVEPVSTNYRGHDVWEIPPNGQGIAVLQILNMLEQFDIGSLQPNSAEQLHLFVEAKKLAYEDRAVYYADPAMADVPVEWLISKDYGKERAKLIDPQKASARVVPGELRGSDTVYLTAADKDGNMVSLIQSIYGGWGSHIVPGKVGFCIQNRGESFSLDENHRNKLEGHKRPFHTIIPAFVTREGAPVFSFGVMGGDFQPQGHSQVLMDLIDFGMSPQQAGDQPRIEHTGSSEPTGEKMEAGGKIRFERRFPDEIKRKLADMGHAVREGEGAFGGYQGIWREEEPRRYFGGSDPRKDGCAIGY
ncbi:MAG: gamma-glutamyltransferase [FCB group bacterium]|jgi:gamma-glutamyltranspeptidase/glutathione hydrolase|nr:gamma-glutamyltransferase [FCB group bacterium]